MKNRVKLLAGAAALLLLTGCGRQGEANEARTTEATYRQISQEEAAEIMNKQEDFLLLDVCTQAEYEDGHIPGAICIPNETIGAGELPELPDKNQRILVYCRSGNRSKQAAEKLAKLGYTNVLEFGGINTWTGETVSGSAFQ
ncbi:MAG: rhodanese-like domain-containing protein [Candidatus Faecousia sp.]|nr:rhodanese-like domain-containing protein [Candidatus Faecousia sp.]